MGPEFAALHDVTGKVAVVTGVPWLCLTFNEGRATGAMPEGGARS